MVMSCGLFRTSLAPEMNLDENLHPVPFCHKYSILILNMTKLPYPFSTVAGIPLPNGYYQQSCKATCIHKNITEL